MKIKQKQGQMFTLIAIALLILFFVSYEIYSIINERQSIKTRINTMESFLFSIEKDLERQLYISGFRIVFLAEKQISETGNYISNFETLFQEAIIQGTINGEENEILNGVTIPEIQNNIQEKADKMNLKIELKDVSVSIGQEDPWNLVIHLETNLNLTDKSDLARWYKREDIKSYISIEDFEDPLFLVSTQGKISRKINKTIYEGNYTQDTDISNLLTHLSNKLYASNSNAPSFIDRLEGKKTGNENGIESFVLIPQLSAQGIPVYEKSCVDYIYFSSSNPTSYQITGMPSWFLLDNEHLDKYQVSSLII